MWLGRPARGNNADARRLGAAPVTMDHSAPAFAGLAGAQRLAGAPALSAALAGAGGCGEYHNRLAAAPRTGGRE